MTPFQRVMAALLLWERFRVVAGGVNMENHEQILDGLARASCSISRETDLQALASRLVGQSLDLTESDLACLYLYTHPENLADGEMRLFYRRGKFRVPERLPPHLELASFIRECEEAVVLTERKKSPFADVLLNEKMASGLALPISTPSRHIGILFLNSLTTELYDRERLQLMDSFTRLASSLLNNSQLYNEIRGYLEKIEELECYKEAILTSKANPLDTIDERGRTSYFDAAASTRGTIFFADIRGYTSFSEGRDPLYILEVLNEYFNEAVEIVVRNDGYVDKFIGDCIMAAWGIKRENEETDAVNAVNCAVEIQERIASRQRRFFRGEAEDLKVGIGMHTGPLVVGTLGGSTRMEHTVIGDTVNVAARLEGVSGPGDIIITQATRDRLGERFILEKRDTVKVKGKADEIPIYAVLGRAA